MDSANSSANNFNDIITKMSDFNKSSSSTFNQITSQFNSRLSTWNEWSNNKAQPIVDSLSNEINTI